MLNGSGIGPADAARSFDNDKYKNTMFRLSQDLGEHLRVGGFAYFGREAGTNPNGPGYGTGQPYTTTNDLWMAGPDLTVELENVQFNAQYVERSDENPFFLSPDPGSTTKVKTRGAFAELTITPGGDRGRWYGTALYNWVESDKDALYRTTTLHVGYLLARNFRLVGELTNDMIAKTNKLSVGFVSAF